MNDRAKLSPRAHKSAWRVRRGNAPTLRVIHNEATGRVTSCRGNASSLKKSVPVGPAVHEAQHSRGGLSNIIVTDGLRAYSGAMNDIGVAAERLEVGGRLNIAPRIRISRSDDTNGQCSGFEA